MDDPDTEATVTESDRSKAMADGVAYSGEWQRPTVFYNRTVKYLVYLAIILFFVLNLWSARISLDRLLYGLQTGTSVVTSMLPPDFAGQNGVRIWNAMIETLAMSIVATVAGVIISIPIAVMAAENLAPKPVYYIGRAIISVTRAMHELVVAIIVVVGFGFGALAGVISIVFVTPGFYSKLLAEDLEDIEHTQIDAIRAVGAGPLQVLAYGVLPQVMPRIIGLTIYRWDINVRASTILGVVGAGGIGTILIQSFDRYDYQFTSAIILAIIAVVMVGEVISAYARGRVQ